MYLQKDSSLRWSVAKQQTKMKSCSSLTVTATGEVVLLGESYGDSDEAQWYDQQGNMIHALPSPSQEEFWDLKVLAVEVGGKQQVALSSDWEQCIWLGSRDTNEWSVAWQATGEKWSEEREGQPRPAAMCQGKPGQIIAYNMQGDCRSAVVFDITQIPFRVVVQEMKLGMMACHLCYCELPGVGGALAVAGNIQLSMFSMVSGECLWSIGGKDESWDEKGLLVKVAGAEWSPYAVCSDNRGRLYVADYDNTRIVVVSAASGSVLQVVQGKCHWGILEGDEDEEETWVVDPGMTVYGADIKYKDDEPVKGTVSGTVLQELENHHLMWPTDSCWNENTKSVIVKNCYREIIYFKIEF